MKTHRWLARLTGLVGIVIFICSTLSYAQTTRPRYSSPSSNPPDDMIPVDTIISLRMNDFLSSKNARVGDRFTATVSQPVYVGGRVAIPSGAVVSGRVTQVTPAKRMNKSGVLAIEFDEIALPNGLSTQIIGVLTSDDPIVQKQIDEENRVSGGKGKDATVFIGGSGVLGAILGGVTGGAKGAAVGGAVGAGVGAASVLFSKGEEATVPAGSTFGLRLKQALPIPDDAAVSSSDSTPSSSSQPDSTGNDRSSSADERSRSSQPPATGDVGATNDPRPTLTRPTTKTGENDTVPPVSGSTTETERPSNDPVSDAVDESLPLSSPVMIRRAQMALKEEGYYEGEADGALNPRTVNALKSYQRDHKLPETGALDANTAKSLKITGSQTSPPRGTADSTSRQPVNRPSISETEQPRASDTSLPGGRRTGDSSAGRVNPPTTSSTNPLKIQRQAEELLSEYQQMIGVRITGTGLLFEGRTALTDDEISFYFALDSLVNATQLYGRILPNLQRQDAVRTATLAVAKEARRTDRIFTTMSSRWVNSLNPRWDAFRQEILKLMYTYNISTAELDY